MIILSVHRAREAGAYEQPVSSGNCTERAGIAFKGLGLAEEHRASCCSALDALPGNDPSDATPEQWRMSFPAYVTEDDLHLTGLDRGSGWGSVDVPKLPEDVNPNQTAKENEQGPLQANH